MTEQYIVALISAGAGLFGVLVGSSISWLQAYWLSEKDKRKVQEEREKSARYLAIRIVCILDKFLLDCAEIVKDDGLSHGQRTPQGCLEPQVTCPPVPAFPDDIDWKSIDHDLMYKLLSFPADIEASNRIIEAAWEHAAAPDFEEGFEERAFWYAQFGLNAYKLADELSKKYGIKEKVYKDWNPVEDLTKELNNIHKSRTARMKGYGEFLSNVGLKETAA